MSEVSSVIGPPLSRIDPQRARREDTAAIARMDGCDPDLALSWLSATPDCVKLLHPDGTLFFMNFGGLCAMEIDDASQVIGRKWWELWPAAETERLKQAVAAATRAEVVEFVAFCPTAKGDPRWWAVRVAPVIGRDGQIAQVLAISRDVTELVRRQTELERALEEGRLLQREANHRLKNSLGIVSSMLNLKARSAADAAAEALRDAAMRVRGIASIHDRLYRGDGDAIVVDDYLSSLVDDIQMSLGGTVDIAFTGAGDDVSVPSEVSLALGLIVAELTCNALRHAALSTGDRITVMLTGPSDGRLRLSVADSGCGLPANFDMDRVGMGMTIVKSMAQKIGATLDWRRDLAQGTCFDLTFGAAI